MRQFLLKSMLLTFSISMLLTHHVTAYCAKCRKIEEKRAKEQAEHPRVLGYYDDQISLHAQQDKSSKIKENSDVLALQEGEKRNESFFEENGLERSRQSLPQNQEEKEVVTPSYSPRPHGLSIPSRTYSTLYTIFKTKNFLETLDGSFTLLIPSNEAIQKLSPENLINLIRPKNEEKLAAIVSNHLIARKILKEDFDKNRNLEIKAISGKNLTLSSKDGKLFIDNVQILRIEPAGYDGVIYVIDQVLTP